MLRILCGEASCSLIHRSELSQIEKTSDFSIGYCAVAFKASQNEIDPHSYDDAAVSPQYMSFQ